MQPSEAFALRVKEVRSRRGWTQQELASRITGIGRPALTRIELNDREVTVDDLIQICAALGVSPVHMIVRRMELNGLRSPRFL